VLVLGGLANRRNLVARRQRARGRRTRVGYAFVAPMLVGFLIFSLVPIAAVVVLSFFRWNLSGTPKFVGGHQYMQVFTNPEFWHVMGVTGAYVLYNLPLQWVLSMGLALLLRRRLPGSGLFRTIYLIPWVMTPIAIATLWKWILNPLTGILSYILSLVGVTGPDWFSSSWALRTIALVNIWEFTGFCTVILLVGLQGIPDVYFEAAKVDGAGAWGTFRRVTIPLMRPTLLFIFITGIVGSFQVFDTVYGLTLGGPGTATEVYYYYLYQEAFQFSNFGYACALAVILFLLLLTLTVGQILLFRRGDTQMI
jgi:ABC-type sugar transport system permease subunit